MLLLCQRDNYLDLLEIHLVVSKRPREDREDRVHYDLALSTVRIQDDMGIGMAI
jgi:hypothetical protein